MSPFFWCGFLLIATMALLLLELLVPSGGVLGALSGLTCVSALVIAFREGPWAGLAMIGAIGILVPMVLALAARIWPSTPFGKRIIQPAPSPEDVLPETPDLQRLVGTTGKATTRMLPGGIVVVEGQSYDATAIGDVVEKGDVVTIVRIEGQRLTVRKTALRDRD